jgi:cytochrome subunit of sulfide dehydrogenase
MNAVSASAGVVACVVSGVAALAAAPEPPAGASSCSGCHAPSARADTPIPRLIGRSAADIVAQMQAFKTGQKQSTVMDRIAKGFSDAEIQAIAEWYAQQK